ncbi:MAG: leucine-rich repeat domain-containing protein, partial [Oscillospiraceae bacterium]
MKKRILSIVLCLVMVFSLLPFTASAASAIPINEETFPDPVFREYVLKIVGSSVLTEEKAQQIEVLDVSASNIKKVLGDRAPITSLMGIRYLRYVKDLNCSGQELKKTLNLEQNSRVEKLNCSGNQLTGLWFHKGSSLKYLTCSVNEFTALDLSKCSELIELSCGNNKLTALDLSANKKLQKISAGSNKLTALDTRNLPELTYLNLWGNHDLRSIDVSKNTKLEFLSVSHCKLTSLDVSHNRKLVELFVYNN